VIFLKTKKIARQARSYKYPSAPWIKTKNHAALYLLEMPSNEGCDLFFELAS